MPRFPAAARYYGDYGCCHAHPKEDMAHCAVENPTLITSALFRSDDATQHMLLHCVRSSRGTTRQLRCLRLYSTAKADAYLEQVDGSKGIATLTLDRPSAKNAISVKLLKVSSPVSIALRARTTAYALFTDRKCVKRLTRLPLTLRKLIFQYQEVSSRRYLTSQVIFSASMSS